MTVMAEILISKHTRFSARPIRFRELLSEFVEDKVKPGETAIRKCPEGSQFDSPSDAVSYDYSGWYPTKTGAQ